MRAVQITSTGGPSAVVATEVDEPTRKNDEVLIEVEWAGVSFPDVLQSKGLYQIQPPTPFVPGSEVAGVVREAPAGSEFAAGQKVAAFPGFGGFAERVSVPTPFVLPLPDAVDTRAAAALPMNYLTALFALRHRGRLTTGETVLVQGAAGGIGTASIQVAKASGATVIAVASSQDKRDLATAAGADHAVAADGFKDAVKELTGGRGVDVVVDPVGGDRFTDSLRSLAPTGRLLVIGFTAGDIPTVKVNRLLLNNLDVVGVGWGADWMTHPQVVRQQWDELISLFPGGFEPPIGSTHPLSDAGAALAEIDERRALGKVLLQVR